MTNKQLKAKYAEWLNTPIRYLNDVYGKPSINKMRAELDILVYMLNNDGYGYRVMSFNSSFFTVGYIIQNDEGKLFVYETAQRRYFLPID